MRRVGDEQRVNDAGVIQCMVRKPDWRAALHQITIVMSERGIPKSFRHMHCFGSHTYSFINAANERVWVKFHFYTRQGIENLTDAESGR